MIQNLKGLSKKATFYKRCFDITFSILGLIAVWWLILIGWIIAKLSSRDAGFFIQERVGQYGEKFKVIKLQTMKPSKTILTTVTSSNDPRITKAGSILRKSKLDELPQLINVLKGDMSFVGPRPDVPGFTDILEGEDKVILSLKPGITGPATIFYKDEEKLLARQSDPVQYNKEVIFPKKVELNKEYIKQYSFLSDIKYIIKTVLG